MLTLYLLSLVLGGLLVGVSIFGGGDLDADVEIDTAGEAAGEGVTAAARFLSLRNAVFFVAFFGLTGTLLTLIGMPDLVTPVFAVTTGVIAATALHHVMEHLERNETGRLPGTGELEGSSARVVIDIDTARAGKVAVRHHGQIEQIVARSHPDAEAGRFGHGEEVVIVQVVDGIAWVAGPGFLGR